MTDEYAKQRMIADVRNDDKRIQITAYIKQILDKDTVLLDDQTGELTLDVSNVSFNHKENDLINVFGDLKLSTGGEITLIAEIIQDMNKLNFNYYKKLYEIKKELI
jgi:uncharacterized protein YdeI (BOF family)